MDFILGLLKIKYYLLVNTAFDAKKSATGRPDAPH
jgi:hypothetical protein